jgi:hypothetical protein
VKLLKFFLILTIFTTSLFAQEEMPRSELQFIHLFGEIKKSVSAGKANMEQWEKKVTCYNIGRLQVLSSMLSNSISGYIKNTKRNKRRIERIEKNASKLSKFCTNKVEVISFKGLALNTRLNKINNASAKLYSQLTENFLEGNNVKIGFNRAKILFYSALSEAPVKFEEAIPLTETEVDGQKYKPAMCDSIGKLVTSFEIFKIEAKRANKFYSPLIQSEDSIYDLRDLCFNKRGLNKYFRELGQIKEITQR